MSTLPAQSATDPRADPIYLRSAYAACRRITARHYENFPVASWLLPGDLRDPVCALYAFARRADDIADEGELKPEQRLAELTALENALLSAPAIDDPVMLALSDTLRRFNLPVSPLQDLLSAFRQDVTQHAYKDYSALSDYCRRSANPVGRLLLQLFGVADDDNLACSDALCSALQLINFLQDIQADLSLRGRVYLPEDELREFGVTREDLLSGARPAARLALLSLQSARIHTLLDTAAPLGARLPGRLGMELRMIIAGARRIMNRLASRGADWHLPAKLSWRDRLGLFVDAWQYPL